MFEKIEDHKEESAAPQSPYIPFAKMTLKQRIASRMILLNMLRQNLKAVGNGTVNSDEYDAELVRRHLRQGIDLEALREAAQSDQG